MADWTPEIEERYTELRLRKLTGGLSEIELSELTQIQAMVDAAEAGIIDAGLAQLERKQMTLQQTVDQLQTENHELVELLTQQALLIADSKRWLTEFERRYDVIQTAFTRLTKHPVAG